MRAGIIFDRKRTQEALKSAWLLSNNRFPITFPKRINRVLHQPTDKTTKESVDGEQKEKFRNLVSNSEKVLLKIKGVFPFDFFPDSVVIDVNKVNIIKKNFFLSQRLRSISIKSITEVYIQTSPFFASLYIVDAAMNPGNRISVHYLHKKDAGRARRLIQGLVDATQQEIDLSAMKAEDIVDKLEEAGKIRTLDQSAT